MLLYYIRHGDPIYDPDSLTPLGERQAEAVGKRLALHGIDKIFSSDSVRAQLTAKPLSEMLHQDVTLLPFANEGRAWEQLTAPTENGGKTWCFRDPKTNALFRSPEVLALGTEWYRHPAFADTSYEAGMKRVDEAADEFLESLGYRHDRAHLRYEPIAPNDNRIALFAHQGFGLAFLSSILDIPYPLFSTHFDFSHSAVTVVSFTDNHYADDGIVPKILQFGDESHIYKEGLPTRFENRIYL